MGKKKGMTAKRRAVDMMEEDENEVDPELEAEMQAIRAIQAEKAGLIPQYKDDAGVDSASDGDNNTDDDQEDGDEEEDEEEEVETTTTQQTKPKRQRGLYNKEALTSALESMPTNHMPFVEKLEICEFDVAVADEHDDLQREMTFFNQSLLAVASARAQLKEAGVAYRRPLDYFAESIKSDIHMGKVKERLIHEQKKIEAYEMRRQRETNRKYNKQLQLQKKQERGQSSKEEINAVAALRKEGRGQGKLGGKEDEEGKAKLEKILGRGVGDRGRAEKSQKRKNMDKKYGSGVKERMKAKVSDKKSLNDFKGYSPRGGKFVKRGTGGPAKASGNKGGARPGKSKRDAGRSKSPGGGGGKGKK
jgi:rRNA-processing protein EBP2